MHFGKNLFKRIFWCLLSALIMLPIMNHHILNVHADETASYTVTINETEDNHSYSAYQLFAGDVAQKSQTETGGESNLVLSNITTGAGLQTDSDTTKPNASLIKDLKNNNVLGTKHQISSLTDTASAADIASAISESNLTNEETAALAKVFNAHKTNITSGTCTRKTDNTGYTISNLPAGYYLIVDGKDNSGTPAVYSSLIMNIVGNVEITPKTSTPQIIKKVYDPDYQKNDTVNLNGQTISLGEGYNDVTDAGIYDDVKFEIFSTLPDNYDSYDAYYYAIVDDLDESLTPYSEDNADIDLPANVDDSSGKKYEINDPNVDVSADSIINLDEDHFTLQYSNDYKQWNDLKSGFITYYFNPKSDPTKTRVMVVFTGLQNNKSISKNTVFKLTFDATLNEKAKIGNSEGNKNNAKLSYSNNPQDPASLGETPEDTNVVFSYEMDIHKIGLETGKNNNSKNLENVPFALYKIVDGNKNYLVVNKDKDTDGTYVPGGWDDSKTTIDVKNDSEIYYEMMPPIINNHYLDYQEWQSSLKDEDIRKKFVSYWTEEQDASYEQALNLLLTVYKNYYSDAFSYVVSSDNNGDLKIKGLDAGTYYLEELKAPDGYNQLSNPIQITISPNKVNTQDYLNSTDSNAQIKTSSSAVLTGLNTTVNAGKELITGNYIPDTNVAGVLTTQDGKQKLDAQGEGDVEKGIITVTVVNRSGSVLPDTGGSGTAVFYIAGGALILTAVILLVLYKKKLQEAQ